MVSQKILKVYISFLPRRFSLAHTWLFILIVGVSYSQTIIKEIERDSVNIYLSKLTVAKNKTIPIPYDTVIKIALLFYPELRNTHIKIQVKKQVSPLTARPSLSAVLRKASKRKYFISISDKTNPIFSSILLRNLSFNSQIGVIGHELSHISDYNDRCGIYFIKLLFMHLSKRKIDQFEYNTDLRCINHGLGYQLLSWSTEVSQKLNLIQWKGVKQFNETGRERYMKPHSITEAIEKNGIYKQ